MRTYWGAGHFEQFRAENINENGEYFPDIDNTDIANEYLINRHRIEKGAPENYECFAPGTLVTMADGSQRAIEAVKVGDWVMAFDPSEDGGKGELKPCEVTQTHTREVEETLDFHGTVVTPGHVFLSGDGGFRKIADILEEDGTVVKADGTVIRARTGWPVASDQDRVVPLTYNNPDSGETVTARMRAGAPFTREGGRYLSLVEAMTEVGYTLGPDGLFVSADGDHTVAHFPWGEPDPRILAENRVAFV